MNKQWMLVAAILGGLSVGGFVLAHTDNGGVVGVDTVAPDFKVVALATGDTISLHDTYRGQVTLVNIWATWCAPCRAEMPSMEALYKDYQARGFKIAAVSIDNDGPDKPKEFARELGLTFDILQDPTGDIQGAYQTTGVPESFLLDRNGKIVRRLIGSHDWNSAVNRDLIDRLLASGG
ncbi:MAG TPA: TlpA disulfide reductase family protein [Gemmatimonadales bacterium]|nr:TlpA disulfide reductase family protein [Gemmatimonadales bacterium]